MGEEIGMRTLPSRACPRKIAVIGYSGSGKSTLAAHLGGMFDLPVLHIDTLQFAPGWVIRGDEEKAADMIAFLTAHDADGWVIDGNYSKLSYDRRMAEADYIIHLNFNRISCLLRAYRRYRMYRGRTRADMAAGCPEKMDAEFARWILWNSRTRKARARYRNLCTTYPDKMIILRNQRELSRFMAALRDDSQEQAHR